MKISSFLYIIHKKIRKKNNELINVIQFNEIYVEENESKLRGKRPTFSFLALFPVPSNTSIDQDQCHQSLTILYTYIQILILFTVADLIWPKTKRFFSLRSPILSVK